MGITRDTSTKIIGFGGPILLPKNLSSTSQGPWQLADRPTAGGGGVVWFGGFWGILVKAVKGDEEVNGR